MPILRSGIGASLLFAIAACHEATAATAGSTPGVVRRTAAALACESAPAAAASDTLLIDGSGQFPVAVPRSEGGSLVAFRGRGSHVSLAGRLDLATLDSAGRLQDRAAPTALDSPLDDRNPALGIAPRSELWLAYNELWPGNTNGTLNLDSATFRLRFSRSLDGGRTWSSPVTPRIAGIDTLFAIPFGRIWTLPTGEALMSIYTGARPASRYDTWRPVILTARRGTKWSIRGQLPIGFNETALLPRRGDTLLAVSRSGRNYLAVSMSANAGATWTPPTAVTGSSEVGADVVALPNGEVLLVYGRRVSPKGIYYRRLQLSGLSVSTFTAHPVVAMADTTLDLGYPTVISVNSDGIVRVAYYRSLSDTPGATQLRLATFCPL